MDIPRRGNGRRRRAIFGSHSLRTRCLTALPADRPRPAAPPLPPPRTPRHHKRDAPLAARQRSTRMGVLPTVAHLRMGERRGRDTTGVPLLRLLALLPRGRVQQHLLPHQELRTPQQRTHHRSGALLYPRERRSARGTPRAGAHDTCPRRLLQHIPRHRSTVRHRRRRERRKRPEPVGRTLPQCRGEIRRGHHVLRCRRRADRRKPARALHPRHRRRLEGDKRRRQPHLYHVRHIRQVLRHQPQG